MIGHDNLTLDELQAEFVRLAGVVAEASDERAELLSVMEARKAAVRAKFQVNGATEIEKDTLRVVLDVDSKKVPDEAVAAVEAASVETLP